MKQKKIIILLVLIAVFITSSCERDDICSLDSVTTPRLTIAFYNIENPEQQNPRNVPKFRVQGVGNDETLPELDGASGKQTILLPLKTTETSTQYSFRKNTSVNDNGTPNDLTDDFLDGNEDIITISYTTNQVYVSRACGFKTVFNNVTLTVEDDSDNWIQIIQSVNDNQTIENENAPNFNIFH